MYYRRFLQYWACVMGLLVVVSSAVAGKPAKPPATPVTAVTTDQNFLNNVVDKASPQTTFVLAIDVTGTGTVYKYGSNLKYRPKIGPAASTNPYDFSTYDYGRSESTPLLVEVSDQPDGTELMLCLQGYEEILDSWGKVKSVVYQEAPTVYRWTKSTSAIDAPTFAWLDPNGSNDSPDANGAFALHWDDASPDENATIAMFYGDAFVGNLIALVDLAPDDESDTLTWDTTGVAPGVYFLCASVTDSVGTTDFWSAYPVIVGTPPVADWDWQPETVVDVGTVVGWSCQVEMDGYGNAMAVGTYRDVDGHWAYSYSVYDGQTWSESRHLVESSDGTSWMRCTPALMSMGVNKYLLVYAEESPSQHLFAMYYDGTAWDPVPQTIDQTCESAWGLFGYSDHFGFYNFGAASSNGTAMVAWREVANGTICTRYFNGFCWEPEVSHLPGIQPAIAADDNGNYMIAYFHGETSSPADWHLYSMHYDGFSGTWSVEMPLDVDHLVSWPEEGSYLIGENGPVRLAGAGNNTFVAVYTSWPMGMLGEPRSDIYGCYFNGTIWEEETLLDSQLGEIGDFDQGNIRLTMSPSGSALATWTQYDGTNLVVYGSSFDGTNWALAPTPLSYNTYGDAGSFYSGLTIDDQGNGVATFYDTPYNATYSVVKAHYLAGSGWQLQAVDDTANRPTDREALTGPNGYSSKNRLAGEASGKVILLFSPYTNTLPFTSFSTLEYGD